MSAKTEPCERADNNRRAIVEFMSEYRTASDEGRLHPEIAAELGLKTGRYKFRTCGMRANEAQAAWDCCRKPDRVIARGLRRGEAHNVAMVHDRAVFIAALDIKRLSNDLAMGQMFDGVSKDAFRAFRNRVLNGQTAIISANYWRHLVKMFGPRVPGCIEIHDSEQS